MKIKRSEVKKRERTCGELIDLIREHHAEDYQFRIEEKIPGSFDMWYPEFWDESKVLIMRGVELE